MNIGKYIIFSFCFLFIGCAGYSEHSNESSREDVFSISDEYDDALGWLLTIRYKKIENGARTIGVATNFCRNKGKIPTLYHGVIGSEDESIKEVWACQTEPALNDADVMTGVYCHFIGDSPRYLVDLSKHEKKKAEEKFIKTFIDNKIEYPVGGIYEKYQASYIYWVLAKDSSGGVDPVLSWFKKNCQ